jgi:ammonia channel protein AmtB
VSLENTTDSIAPEPQTPEPQTPEPQAAVVETPDADPPRGTIAEWTITILLLLFLTTTLVQAYVIPTGSMAERWKFSAFCVFAFFMGGFVYPIYANWVWGAGWSCGRPWRWKT